MKYLITIVGPTAIGKTAMAIDIAQHYGCEIISADSRQFFREMNIGTAVPSAEELSAVPHHFIGNKSVFEPYTVGDFEKEALQTIDLLHKQKDTAVLVGGSGLYVDAVLKGFDNFPETTPEIREELTAAYRNLGIEYLQQQLQNLDPLYYQSVDTANPQRLMRALEVCIGSGRPYSDFLQGDTRERPFTPIIIGLTAERPLIYDRINRRVDIMMEQGLEAEAASLLPYRHLNALQTVGYRELFDYFDGKLTLEQSVEEIKKNSRRFAKRQLTWFNKMPGIKWFGYPSSPADILQYIDSIKTAN